MRNSKYLKETSTGQIVLAETRDLTSRWKEGQLAAPIEQVSAWGLAVGHRYYNVRVRIHEVYPDIPDRRMHTVEVWFRNKHVVYKTTPKHYDVKHMTVFRDAQGKVVLERFTGPPQDPSRQFIRTHRTFPMNTCHDVHDHFGPFRTRVFDLIHSAEVIFFAIPHATGEVQPDDPTSCF